MGGPTKAKNHKEKNVMGPKVPIKIVRIMPGPSALEELYIRLEIIRMETTKISGKINLLVTFNLFIVYDSI